MKTFLFDMDFSVFTIGRQLCVPELSLVKLKHINQSLAGLNAKCTDPSQTS